MGQHAVATTPAAHGKLSAAVLTVSSSVAAGRSENRSGPLLAQALRQAGVSVLEESVVTDERGLIAAELRSLLSSDPDVILTSGGTGLTADDVTPQATEDVIERAVPGIAEALRAASMKHTAAAMLSRATAGTAGRSLIVNLPGSPKAAQELLPILLEVLPHASLTLRRRNADDRSGH
jgi:molybdenum cofactor synthesis domain-containing protein